MAAPSPARQAAQHGIFKQTCSHPSDPRLVPSMRRRLLHRDPEGLPVSDLRRDCPNMALLTQLSVGWCAPTPATHCLQCV